MSVGRTGKHTRLFYAVVDAAPVWKEIECSKIGPVLTDEKSSVTLKMLEGEDRVATVAGEYGTTDCTIPYEWIDTDKTEAQYNDWKDATEYMFKNTKNAIANVNPDMSFEFNGKITSFTDVDSDVDNIETIDFTIQRTTAVALVK